MIFDSHNFFYSISLVDKIKMVFGINDDLINKLLSSGFHFNFTFNRFEAEYIIKHHVFGDINTNLFLTHGGDDGFHLQLIHKETSYTQSFKHYDISTLLILFHLDNQKLPNLHLIVKIRDNYTKLQNKKTFNTYSRIVPDNLVYGTIKSYYGEFLDVDATRLHYRKRINNFSRSYNSHPQYANTTINLVELPEDCLEELLEYQEANLSIPEKMSFSTFREEEKRTDIDFTSDVVNDKIEEDEGWYSSSGIEQSTLTEEEKNNLNLIHFYGNTQS